MLTDIKYPKSGVYRTGSENEPYQFYFESLLNSNSLDLLLGYFSSSAINILSFGFAYFLYRGGKVRMVINHILSEDDSNMVKEAKSGSVVDYSSYLENFEDLNIILKEYGQHFFKCLAWLIANDRIEIVIVKPLGKRGISHYKSGCFSDGVNQVHFSASCNFSKSGLLGNLESLYIRPSWEGKHSIDTIEEEKEYFESIFNGTADFVKYVDDVNDIKIAIQNQFGGNTIEDLIDESFNLQKKNRLILNDKCKSIIASIRHKILKEAKNPKFPYPTGPREYQIEAYRKWIENDKKGIFAMATGTGKTITALNCVLNECLKEGNYRAIIIVPTIELITQWQEEVEGFNFNNVVSVSASNQSWRNDIKRINVLSQSNENYSFFIITTYRSFATDRFQRLLTNSPKNTIMIADEAHNCGANSIVRLLNNIKLEKRIGLSATPERIYDFEGTQKVNDFFKNNQSYTYEFTMKKALEKEYLCKYYYYPIVVELTENEIKKYIEISIKLGKFFNNEKLKKTEAVKKLLLLRKQILHKAENKLIYFNQIISKLLHENTLKHTLVYAPEGYFNDMFSNRESYSDLDVDESRICEFYSNRIRRTSPNTKVALFNADTKDREFVIENFSSNRIDVLVSMKCLDEGVDIPRTETAIFCASTGNPRQFIQRRGRILRKHDDKSFAKIYDLVVVPKLDEIAGDYRIEKKLVENELKRVYEFASLALNKYVALSNIRILEKIFKINNF